jgi:hypothetical protein
MLSPPVAIAVQIFSQRDEDPLKVSQPPGYIYTYARFAYTVIIFSSQGFGLLFKPLEKVQTAQIDVLDETLGKCTSLADTL